MQCDIMLKCLLQSHWNRMGSVTIWSINKKRRVSVLFSPSAFSAQTKWCRVQIIILNAAECIAVRENPVSSCRTGLVSFFALVSVLMLLFSPPTQITRSRCKVSPPVLAGLSTGILGIAGNHRSRSKQALIWVMFTRMCHSCFYY